MATTKQTQSWDNPRLEQYTVAYVLNWCLYSHKSFSSDIWPLGFQCALNNLGTCGLVASVETWQVVDVALQHVPLMDVMDNGVK